MHRGIWLLLAVIMLSGRVFLVNQKPSDALQHSLSAYLPPECLEDARLRHPVTFDASALPVSEVLRRLQDDTGVALSPSREAGSLRVCVHVREMPLVELMASLAGVLDLSWRPVGKETKGYELYQAPQQRNRLLQQAQQRSQEALKAIQDAMLLAGYRIVSGEVLPSTPPQSEGNIDDAVSALAQMFQREPAMLRVMSSLSPQQLAQLIQGEPQLILGSQLPPEVQQALTARLPSRSEGEQYPVFVEIVPDTLTRSMMFSVRRDKGMWGTGIASLFETDAYLSKFEKAVDVLDEETGKRAVRAEKPLSLPEAIALLAQATKLNVVAEYYPLTMHDRVTSPGDAGAILKQLCTPRLYSARRLGETLWLTAFYRAEHRQGDIPDLILKRWFTSEEEFGITTDIALEIARLSYAQRRALGAWTLQQETFDNISSAKRQVYSDLKSLTGRSITAIILRLLASLPSPVRTRTLNGTPLPLRDLALGNDTNLLELVSYLPPDLQDLWFDTDAPCWLQIRRSTTAPWASEERGQVWRSASPPRQISQTSSTSHYRLRVEKIQAYLQTPSGSLLLSEWEWHRFKRL